MRHDAGGASAWRGCHMLYKYTETEVKNIDNENPRNRNGNAAKPDLHCMKIHIHDRFYCRRSAKRAFLHCREARSALLKSTLHAMKEPLSQCGKASFAASSFPFRMPEPYKSQTVRGLRSSPQNPRFRVRNAFRQFRWHSRGVQHGRIA